MGISEDGKRKYYNEDENDWVESQKLATKYADLDRCRDVWMRLTEGGRKHPAGFKRVFTPNYSAEESIITRNTQRRNKKTTESRNSRPYKYSKDAYEAVATELNATIPPEYLNNPSEVNFKKILQMKSEKEAEEKRQAELAERKAKAQAAASKIIEAVKSSEDKMQTLFDLLVPGSGPAETKAGELVRAMMRIQYRDWNDGDVFYEGYGLETAGPSAEYLMGELPELEQDFLNISENGLTDEDYTSALDGIANKIIDHIINNPELFYEPNEDDSREWDVDWLKEHQPKYDFNGNLPDGLDNVMSRHEIEATIEDWYLSGCGSLRNCADEVSVGYGTVDIYGLTRDAYDQLEHHFDDWIEEVANENGLYDEEDDEDEEASDESKKGSRDAFDTAYESAYCTICGAGGNLDEWKDGIQSRLDAEKAGTIKDWSTFKGADMNKKYRLKGSKAYPDDFTFLLFSREGLDPEKLERFKENFGLKGFNDIVDQNKL